MIIFESERIMCQVFIMSPVPLYTSVLDEWICGTKSEKVKPVLMQDTRFLYTPLVYVSFNVHYTYKFLYRRHFMTRTALPLSQTSRYMYVELI